MISTWIIYALLSAVFAAAVAILGKIGLSHVDTSLATAIRSVVMAVVLVIATLSLGKFDISKIDHKALFFIVLSALAGALSWFFYFGALKNGPATAVAALDRLSVVFVLVLAVLFLGEALTWKTGLGAVLVSIGAILLAL